MEREELETREHPAVTGRSPGGNPGGETLRQQEEICDYDKNATDLYTLLEANNWERARIQARSVPREVRTWIVRRDSETGKIRWKLLPLHAAVIFQAPISVIAVMLEVYPKAAAQSDDQGMLPLHLAFRHKQQDETLLEILLEKYPQAVKVKDRRDRLPIEHGAELQFSAKLVQSYAAAHAKTADSTSVASTKAESLKRTYDTQIEAMRVMYEERIAVMSQRHEEDNKRMEDAIRENQVKAREEHGRELSDLRELLSRQVGNGHQVEGLEMEIKDLKSHLADSEAKIDTLEEKLQNSRDCKHDMRQMRQSFDKALEDLRTLQTVCRQQHSRLQDSSRMRKKLLETLLEQEDDPRIAKSSTQMCDIADKVQRGIQQLAPGGRGRQEQDRHREASQFIPVSSYNASKLSGRSHAVREDAPAAGWGVDHDDEISAITELSNFR